MRTTLEGEPALGPGCTVIGIAMKDAAPVPVNGVRLLTGVRSLVPLIVRPEVVVVTGNATNPIPVVVVSGAVAPLNGNGLNTLLPVVRNGVAAPSSRNGLKTLPPLDTVELERNVVVVGTRSKALVVPPGDGTVAKIGMNPPPVKNAKEPLFSETTRGVVVKPPVNGTVVSNTFPTLIVVACVSLPESRTTNMHSKRSFFMKHITIWLLMRRALYLVASTKLLTPPRPERCQ